MNALADIYGAGYMAGTAYWLASALAAILIFSALVYGSLWRSGWRPWRRNGGTR